jgi:hypothetical protein
MMGGTISLLAFTTFGTTESMMEGGVAVTVATDVLLLVVPLALDNVSACGEDKGATMLLPVMGLDKLLPVIGLVGAGLLVEDVAAVS